MTDISSIPLNNIVDSAENVRTTAGADTTLQELAVPPLPRRVRAMTCHYPRARRPVRARRLGTLLTLAPIRKIEADSNEEGRAASTCWCADLRGIDTASSFERHTIRAHRPRNKLASRHP